MAPIIIGASKDLVEFFIGFGVSVVFIVSWVSVVPLC